MSNFLSKEKLGTDPWLRGRVRHDILVFSLEERMEDCVIIWHPTLVEDVVGHPRKEWARGPIFLRAGNPR